MSVPLIYAPSSISDTLDRPLRDLRISVTDRCNFRCTYCMPKEVFNRDFKFLDRNELLNFDEITRLTRLFVALGARKIRLTGGEPLLRRDLPLLVSKLSEISGVEEVTLTTNGSLLAAQAGALKEAGLTRVTVSLDSLDNAVFTQMNDVNFPVERVLEGITAASQAGLLPVKVNMVVKRGVNDDSVLEMARYFKGSGHILRFIEYMDVGSSNGWKMDEVVSSREIVETINREFPLVPVTANYSGEVARRYRYADGSGEIGLISSVTQPFCSSCTRARLSAKGELYTCLFASRGTDLRALLRSGHDDEEISAALEELWRGRNDRYSQVRSNETSKLHKVEMSHIGG